MQTQNCWHGQDAKFIWACSCIALDTFHVVVAAFAACVPRHASAYSLYVPDRECMGFADAKLWTHLSMSCQPSWLHASTCKRRFCDMRRMLNASGLAVAMPWTHSSASCQPSWLACFDMQAHKFDMRRMLNASGLAAALPWTPSECRGSLCCQRALTRKRIFAACAGC